MIIMIFIIVTITLLKFFAVLQPWLLQGMKKKKKHLSSSLTVRCEVRPGYLRYPGAFIELLAASS